MDVNTEGKGPYRPRIILHGGAGVISRSHLPPELYARYKSSLLSYLTRTRALLSSGGNSLDAAVHAVSLMEDDELFNCGRGSVFNLNGEIEMEASVMVASVQPEISTAGAGKEHAKHTMVGIQKRAAAVSMLRETRHPIQLAREVLLEGDEDAEQVRNMHCHLSGHSVEQWGWDRGLERKGKDWFWTQRRWEEHKRGLNKNKEKVVDRGMQDWDVRVLPSQGTVGAVCLDQWGNLAVATSTGGLTNKKPGRIGDTPTVGAGFWAESWDQQVHGVVEPACDSWTHQLLKFKSNLFDGLRDCVAPAFADSALSDHPQLPKTPLLIPEESSNSQDPYKTSNMLLPHAPSSRPARRRAVAMSGTGNGDSFLRTDAARTAAARCKYGSEPISLSEAVRAVAGTGGELQRSAGDRFGRTGEGEGGIIGIEVLENGRANVVFDFNCEGMWRAWYEEAGGKEVPRVMVYRDEYH